MRTLKTSAMLAALLLVAGSASASVILTLTGGGAANTTITVGLSFNPDPYAPGVAIIGFDLNFGGTAGATTQGFLGALAGLGTDVSTTGTGTHGDWGCFSANCGPTTGSAAAFFTQDITGWDGNIAISFANSDTSFCETNAGPGNSCGPDTGLQVINNTTPLPIPEPTTAALLGLGLVGLVFGGRRR
jgi:hypothetical protein